MARLVDRDAPPTDDFKLSDPTASEAKDQDVDISETKLPQPPLL
jgi:hypothetical protein